MCLNKLIIGLLIIGLIVRQVSALGGDEAIHVLTQNPKLIELLKGWLRSADDASTLQRLAGVFQHLSRSPESARKLSAQGVLEALRDAASGKKSGSSEARAAFMGLVNMAMANIVVRQQRQVLQIETSQIRGIKNIVGFLRLALHQQSFHGIVFRYGALASETSLQ